jgi:hypothetical protein
MKLITVSQLIDFGETLMLVIDLLKIISIFFNYLKLNQRLMLIY